jgi:hypothetical protein
MVAVESTTDCKVTVREPRSVKFARIERFKFVCRSHIHISNRQLVRVGDFRQVENDWFR